MNLAEPHGQQTAFYWLKWQVLSSISSPWDVTLKKARIELECCLKSEKPGFKCRAYHTLTAEHRTSQSLWALECDVHQMRLIVALSRRLSQERTVPASGNDKANAGSKGNEGREWQKPLMCLGTLASLLVQLCAALDVSALSVSGWNEPPANVFLRWIYVHWWLA